MENTGSSKIMPTNNFIAEQRLCVILRYSQWIRNNQNTGKMYMIKPYKNFLKDFVVEQNRTCPKDNF